MPRVPYKIYRSNSYVVLEYRCVCKCVGYSWYWTACYASMKHHIHNTNEPGTINQPNIIPSKKNRIVFDLSATIFRTAIEFCKEMPAVHVSNQIDAINTDRNGIGWNYWPGYWTDITITWLFKLLLLFFSQSTGNVNSWMYWVWWIVRSLCAHHHLFWPLLIFIGYGNECHTNCFEFLCAEKVYCFIILIFYPTYFVHWMFQPVSTISIPR